ncbi:MAG: glycosyltransferase family 2 protein, partial [Candidatus Eisenbacteria bacterium]
MSGLPRLSVIVVTHKRPLLLADALCSVAAQTLLPFEVRLADDGGAASLDFLAHLPLLELTALTVACGQAAGARNEAAKGAR